MAAAGGCLPAGRTVVSTAAPLLLIAGTDFVSRPADFCEKYGERFLTQGTVLDAARTGRPRLIAAEDGERAAELLHKGYGTGKRDDGYTSIKQAVQDNPELAAVAKRGTPKQCSARTLQRAIKRAKPFLGKVTVHFGPPLTKEQCAKRLDASKKNLKKWREDRSYFRCGEEGRAWVESRRGAGS